MIDSLVLEWVLWQWMMPFNRMEFFPSFLESLLSHQTLLYGGNNLKENPGVLFLSSVLIGLLYSLKRVDAVIFIHWRLARAPLWWIIPFCFRGEKLAFLEEFPHQTLYYFSIQRESPPSTPSTSLKCCSLPFRYLSKDCRCCVVHILGTDKDDIISMNHAISQREKLPALVVLKL